MPSSDTKTTQGHSPQSLASFGCQNCREQHLKCDRVTPTCGRCLYLKRECRPTGLKIRATKKTYTKTQKWIKTPRRLLFIDETKEVAKYAQSQDGATYATEEDIGSPSNSDVDVDDSERELAHPRAAASPSKSPLSFGPASPTDRFILHEDASQKHGPQDTASNALENRASRQDSEQQNVGLCLLTPRIYLDEPVWPLSNPAEAVLFRHFVQKLAIWLDLCDPFQSFEILVPQRSGTCPILLNAIFALSARHMSHISSFDPLASNRYHEECLRYLIPMLDHAETISDENLFAATIILRVLEEMEVKNMGMDNHGYLLGIHAFVHGSDRRLVTGSLSAASFWVGLRQEIYSAVMNHRPVRINMVHSLVDRSLCEADDYSWANRAVVHCADVLNFCFGDESGPATPRWEELDTWNKQWLALLPASCAPIFQANSDEDAFPEIWYHRSCHVIGAQHHLLAELFLIRFDPKVPRIGGYRRTAEKVMTERIQRLVRKVCGIGLGNQWTPPSMFTACMAIAAFGDHFPERRDQEAMIDILKKTEKDHARPTEAVQEQMMGCWGWMAEDY
ncbi:hypothetical protein QBC46DRAFT_392691 [Diplogelasinospora grovesii]|uniref:Zn(2)-C6 fungal-type domain-containing protein n=1 Tax=Diplogelasinospora grovesii TaxID=303347 RepID=A0AAN6N293_9PEZI|nr:hypothetical protein QBC46DRAFT_392691 [Diplogelasinospora grovesii]